MIKTDDTRMDAVVDLLQGYPDGLPVEEVAHKLAVSYWVARRTLQVLGTAKRVAVVHTGNGKAVWATARNAPPLQARLAAASKINAALRQRERRATNGRSPAPRAKLYDREMDLDAVPDLPIVRRVLTCWPPLRQAPGPTSVFSLGASHA